MKSLTLTHGINRAYLPENLDLKKMIRSLEKGQRKEKYLYRYAYILSQLYFRRFTNKKIKGDNPYISLHQKSLREILSKRLTKIFIDDLISLGIIECNRIAIVGVRSFGYRFSKKYRNQPIKSYINTDTYIIGKLKFIQSKQSTIIDEETHISQMKKYIHRFEIDYLPAKHYIEDTYSNNINKFNSRMTAIDMLKDQAFFFSRDDNGRIHSNISSFPKDLKKYLVVRDLSTNLPLDLTEIDIKTSQPVFLLVRLIRDKSISKTELDKYRNMLQDGFYEFFMDRLRIDDRDEVKQDVFKQLFYNKHSAPIQTDYETVFENEFPEIFAFISKIKKKKDGNSVFAGLLQRTESLFIIDWVSKKHILEKPDSIIATIHDSIIIETKYSQEYSDFIKNSLHKRYGIEVNITTKNLNA